MHNLTQRQVEILRSVIEEYIETAEPVGSETIEKKHNLSASPATIRNEMVKLSEYGYLKKPHSSAGRIPTAMGMKFYVRELMKLIKDVDFWDVDVIPEDYRIFFKAFYNKKGNIWVEPIFLETSMDAALSKGYINSLKNKYHQERRWSWGVSDNPLFIKWWLTVPGVPFFRKTNLTINVLWDHILWPSYWFIITIAANVMAIINPVYSRTTLGFSLPQIAGSILSIALVALLAMLFIDYKNRPTNKHLPLHRKILFPFEFLLMPIVGFFLSALPALISHTQLMLGKRLEYKVTDKA